MALNACRAASRPEGGAFKTAQAALSTVHTSEDFDRSGSGEKHTSSRNNTRNPEPQIVVPDVGLIRFGIRQAEVVDLIVAGTAAQNAKRGRPGSGRDNASVREARDGGDTQPPP